MSAPSRRVILIEDSLDDADLLQMDLNDAGLDIVLQRVEDEATLLAALAQTPRPLAVISDGNLPRFSGAKALASVRAHTASLPFAFFIGALDPRAEFDHARTRADVCLLKQHPEQLIAWLAALPAA